MIRALLNQNRRNILAINRRNQVYIRPHNPPSAKSFADNKLLTKRVLSRLGIQTPELFKVIRTRKQLEYLDWTSLPNSFVVKPNRGSLGSGILIFYGKKRNSLEWIRPNERVMDIADISTHMEKILEGRFSMGNNTDLVIIEERIKTHSELKKYSYKGVPDIRLIVYNQIPVMAMIRLPTKRSDGKANLHAGGVCAGVDIASGVTTYAMQMKSKSILEDTYETVEFTSDLKQKLPVRGIKIPYWNEILEISVKCQHASKLGYLGVDIVIDKDKGPLVLELNARPGLGIQAANNAGLRERLERVEGLKVKSIKHSLRIAKNLFGGEVEEGIEALSGKQVVNLVEKISIYYNRKKEKKDVVSGMLDTGILTSRIDRGLASRIGFSEALKAFDKLGVPEKFENLNSAQEFIDQNSVKLSEYSQIERFAKITEFGHVVVRPVFDIKIRIAGVTKVIEAVISSQTDMVYPILIGRSELKDYLIDASKTFTQ